MNTNDIPPAQRMAALIEAGRAANPDLRHGQGSFLDKGHACAIGFACLGAGMTRKELGRASYYPEVAPVLGVPYNSTTWDNAQLLRRIASMNDSGWSLDALVRDLREGELAALTK